ncbi:MAG: Cytochrome c biogenesis ATP-binding export protein CcmA [Candidatus Erwinia impunctatus]|nr:Cytochrome c biogenesis ATP-binding export protein CcmA [Culicoides impunctatus]
MLEAINLTCIRDERVLFNMLTVTIKPGEIVQIAGENGAGKTSLLRILAGLSKGEHGEVRWNGQSIEHDRQRFHTELIYLGHQSGIKTVLTAAENLHFYHPHATFSDVMLALDKVGLMGYEESVVATLSAGQQRRVALARLCLTQARLWILDEPLTALDQSRVAALMMHFQTHLAGQGMVLLTTHQALPLPDTRVRQLSLTSPGEKQPCSYD